MIGIMAEVIIMKKILPILVVSILVLSGLGAVAINIDQNNSIYRESITGIISEKLEIDVQSRAFNDENENYVKPVLNEDELYLLNPGQPMIPRILKTYELPFGVTDINVEVVPQRIQKQTIHKEILPATAPLPYSQIPDFVPGNKKDQRVYNSNELFPSSWYSHHVGCGLNAVQRPFQLKYNLKSKYPMRTQRSIFSRR